MNKKLFQLLIGAAVITGALGGIDGIAASNGVACNPKSSGIKPKGCTKCGQATNMGLCVLVCSCPGAGGYPVYPALGSYDNCEPNTITYKDGALTCTMK